MSSRSAMGPCCSTSGWWWSRRGIAISSYALFAPLREPATARRFTGVIRGDHFADSTTAQHFKTSDGKPLAIPDEAAGTKPEYLEWHRKHHGLSD